MTTIVWTTNTHDRQQRQPAQHWRSLSSTRCKRAPLLLQGCQPSRRKLSCLGEIYFPCTPGLTISDPKTSMAAARSLQLLARTPTPTCVCLPTHVIAESIGWLFKFCLSKGLTNSSVLLLLISIVIYASIGDIIKTLLYTYDISESLWSV